jgi:hypothetical protein
MAKQYPPVSRPSQDETASRTMKSRAEGRSLTTAITRGTSKRGNQAGRAELGPVHLASPSHIERGSEVWHAPEAHHCMVAGETLSPIAACLEPRGRRPPSGELADQPKISTDGRHRAVPRPAPYRRSIPGSGSSSPSSIRRARWHGRHPVRPVGTRRTSPTVPSSRMQSSTRGTPAVLAKWLITRRLATP